MKRNPKQEGTNLFDCIPQKGPCPNKCSQCFYNHNFYLPIDRVHFPHWDDVGEDGIVRVNSGHDSNIERDQVIGRTHVYPKRFFNTSIPEFDFPDPVVFTANASEERNAWLPEHLRSKRSGVRLGDKLFDNLMFVRLRTSSMNVPLVANAAEKWGEAGVPVLLTFMRYYDESEFAKQNRDEYVQRSHITNTYWCPSDHFMRAALKFVSAFNSKIEMCGTPRSSLCKDCLCCEKYYYQAKRRMQRG